MADDKSLKDLMRPLSAKDILASRRFAMGGRELTPQQMLHAQRQTKRHGMGKPKLKGGAA